MADPTPRENFQEMRKRPRDEFVAYLWDYYSKPALVVLIVLICIGSFIYDLCTKKEMALYGLMMDCYNLHEETLIENDFIEFAGIDTEKQHVYLMNNLSMSSEDLQLRKESEELFWVKTAANEVDIITLNTIQFQTYERDLMQDLREILSEEQLEAIGDAVYYVDMANLIPGSTDPTGFEDPVPVGIDMNRCEKFAEYYMPANNGCIMGICVNSEHMNYAVKFVELLFPIE